MSIRAIIVDDEQDAREVLEYIITNYCKDIELVGVASNADEAFKIILKEKPNLLLLDIEIANDKSNENSFDLLKRLPTYNFEVIFITAYNEYALQAIKLHAFDYLLKPVNVQELVNSIGSIKQNEGVKNLMKNSKN